MCPCIHAARPGVNISEVVLSSLLLPLLLFEAVSLTEQRAEGFSESGWPGKPLPIGSRTACVGCCAQLVHVC